MFINTQGYCLSCCFSAWKNVSFDNWQGDQKLLIAWKRTNIFGCLEGLIRKKMCSDLGMKKMPSDQRDNLSICVCIPLLFLSYSLSSLSLLSLLSFSPLSLLSHSLSQNGTRLCLKHNYPRRFNVVAKDNSKHQLFRFISTKLV